MARLHDLAYRNAIADERETEAAYEYARSRALFASGADRRQWARKASALLIVHRKAAEHAAIVRAMH